MLMRKERKHSSMQPNLFRLPVALWQTLPLEAQEKIWFLLVQLFREARRPQEEEEPISRKGGFDE
jgi:hypothetical protein